MLHLWYRRGYYARGDNQGRAASTPFHDGIVVFSVVACDRCNTKNHGYVTQKICGGTKFVRDRTVETFFDAWSNEQRSSCADAHLLSLFVRQFLKHFETSKQMGTLSAMACSLSFSAWRRQRFSSYCAARSLFTYATFRRYNVLGCIEFVVGFNRELLSGCQRISGKDDETHITLHCGREG